MSYNDIIYHESSFRLLKDAIKNSNLRELDLSGNQLGHGGWRCLASAINQISKL